MTPAIWAHYLTRGERENNKKKPKYQWLSYGIQNGIIKIKINEEIIHWKKLSPSEQAATTEKLKPLKWLLQK